MRHAREDYNRFQDPSGKIPIDEPVFLLRGQDELAPALLIQWAEKLIARGGNKEMAKIVTNHAAAMVAWQKTHGGKLPDMPKAKAECNEPSVEDRVRAIFVDKLALEPEEMTSEAGLYYDLGMDELDGVEILMDLEKEFTISITDAEWEPIKLYKEVIELVSDKLL